MRRRRPPGLREASARAAPAQRKRNRCVTDSEHIRNGNETDAQPMRNGCETEAKWMRNDSGARLGWARTGRGSIAELKKANEWDFNLSQKGMARCDSRIDIWPELASRGGHHRQCHHYHAPKTETENGNHAMVDARSLRHQQATATRPARQLGRTDCQACCISRPAPRPDSPSRADGLPGLVH